jgi:hypothetical protein
LTELGLPDGRVVNSFFNSASKTTLVELEVREDPPVRRLFTLAGEGTAYACVAGPAEAESWEGATNSGSSYVFACKIELVSDGRGYARFCRSMLKIDLSDSCATKEIALVDVSIIRILRADDAGVNVDVIALFREGLAGGKKRARYAICTVDSCSATLVELAELPLTLL